MRLFSTMHVALNWPWSLLLHHSLIMDVIDAMSVDYRRNRSHHLVVDVIKFLSCEFRVLSNSSTSTMKASFSPVVQCQVHQIPHSNMLHSHYERQPLSSRSYQGGRVGLVCHQARSPLGKCCLRCSNLAGQ